MCGAPVASLDTANCDHCGARLATVACPSCFATIFQGAKFCSHCGAAVGRRELESESNISCPHCDVRLESVVVGNAQLRECPKCEGIWVKNADFTEICADREQQAAVLGMPFVITDNPVSPVDLKVRYYRCPVCKDLMNRVNFAHCSGVIVDVCRADGTWFDKDELRRIIEFIRNGGLDKARGMEIEELKRQQQQLKSMQSAGAASGDSLNRSLTHFPAALPTTKYDLVGWGISAALLALRIYLRR